VVKVFQSFLPQALLLAAQVGFLMVPVAAFAQASVEAPRNFVARIYSSAARMMLVMQ